MATGRPELVIDLRVNDAQAAPALDGARRRVDSLADSMGSASASSDGLARALGRIAQYGFGALIAQQVAQAGRAIYDAAVEADRLSTTLNFASARGAAQELGYLRGVTQELGLSMKATAPAFASFLAAARGTAIEGQVARDVFLAVSQAASVMGLSADQTAGALLALQQMVSKGTVQAEELRGQLGERLPGAFQIAARAMGVTTAELGKLLERGEVVADQFLPRFAAQLRSEIGGAAEKAAERLEASTNRMANAWQQLLQNLADAGGRSSANFVIKSLTQDIQAMNAAMDIARANGSGVIGQTAAAAKAIAGRALQLQFLDPSFGTLDQQIEAARAAYIRAADYERLLGSGRLNDQLFGNRVSADDARRDFDRLTRVRQGLAGDDGSGGSDYRFERSIREAAEVAAADAVMSRSRASFREQELDIFGRRVKTERAKGDRPESLEDRVKRVLAADLNPRNLLMRSERASGDEVDKALRERVAKDEAEARREAAQLAARQADLQQRSDDEYQNRVNAARDASTELAQTNAELNAALIRDDRERGLAQIGLQERMLRERLNLDYLNVEERQKAEDELARWRVLREAQLTEDLKPVWQRMAEQWADTMRDMAQRKDDFLQGFVDRGRDAFQDFLATGRLSTRTLTDFIRSEFARMAYERFLSSYVRGAASWLFDAFLGGGGGGGTSGGGNGGFGSLIALDSLPGRAGGGRVAPGGMYMVGERGPELLAMGSTGGYVVPNSQVRQMAGGVTIHQTFSLRGNEDAATLRSLAAMVKHETLAAVAESRARGVPAFAG